MQLRQWCSYVWWWLTHEGDPQEVEKFKVKLWRPPVGAVIPQHSPWSAENESKAFESLKAGFNK